MDENDSIQLIHSLMLLVLLAGGFMVHFRNRMGTALKYAGIWLIIIMAMVLLYSYKHDFKDIKNRLAGSLSPASAIQNNDGSISIRISVDGHYYINTEINGKKVRFMVDTGASDVVLDKDTARKLGFDVDNLSYIRVYNTANGTVRGAPIRLNRIKVGDYEIFDVRASVNEADMKQPLLGMSFLNKLEGYEVRNDIFTMWP